MDTKGAEQGGGTGLNGIDMYTLLCMKQMTNENLLDSWGTRLSALR